MMNKISVMMIAMILAMVSLALAVNAVTVPTFITYQGKIINQTTSDPIANVSMRINITEMGDLSNVTWSKDFFNVTDANGVFDLVLGARDVLELVPGKNYQLVVCVDTDNSGLGNCDSKYGDNSTGGEAIIVNSGIPQNAAEIMMSDYSETVEDKINSLLPGSGSDIWNMSGLNVFLMNISKNVGIGTMTPTQKLEVNGSVNVTQDIFVGQGITLGGDYKTAWPSGGGITYLNFTPGTYNGNIVNGTLNGYAAADAICNQTYLGTRMCTEFDVTEYIANEDFSWVNGEAWIISGGAKYSPAPLPVNDCNGWTHGSAGSYLGNWWYFNQTGGGQGKCGHCGNTLPLACCR